MSQNCFDKIVHCRVRMLIVMFNSSQEAIVINLQSIHDQQLVKSFNNISRV
jgi:hypothetical protein